LLYKRTWQGTHLGCDCLGVASKWIQNDNEMILGHSCSINQTLAGCQTAQPISSIDEKFLKKKLICGRTNGNTFLTTERADAKGKCEDGKVLCGKSTF
jgi:hypothetical protein